MALVLADRVQETTTTSGTGTITLAGAVAGFQSFSVVGNGNTTYYTIVNGNNWEVGIGTYTSAGTTLARLHATGPLVCKGRWKCLSDINKVPNANGICVDPEEVKPIPRQYTQKMIHTTPKPEPAKTE